MKIRTKSQAIWDMKCPRCREGNVFEESGNSFAKFTDTHKHCPHCGLRYEPEPNFFQGAMYISSGFTTLIMLGMGLLVFVLSNYVLGNKDADLWVYILAVALGILVSFRYIFRISRVLMLHWFSGFGYLNDEEREKLKKS
jgi:uncharacterized protein (DUF983 family)